jgi:hypothetical protein
MIFGLFIDIKSWPYHAMNLSKVKTRIGHSIWGRRLDADRILTLAPGTPTSVGSRVFSRRAAG